MIAAIYRGIHEYLEDKDVSRIRFYRFNQDKDGVAPSISLCFNNMFVVEQLRKFVDVIDSVSYRSFLQGKATDDKMTKIDYDNVTLDINDYLYRIKFVTSLGNVHTFDPNLEKYTDDYFEMSQKVGHQLTPDYYVSWRSAMSKCYTFDIPFIKGTRIISLGIALKKSLFGSSSWADFNGMNFTHSSGRQDLGFNVLFAYPGQLTHAPPLKQNW